MMNTEPAYDDLLKQYRELLLRVTRFSVVEQQLINTRDHLDHELVMYKRLNNFNADALNESKECGFFKLVAEAIVDIFEMEAGVAHVRNYESNGDTKITLEGLQIDDETKHRLSHEISLLGQGSLKGVVINLKEFNLSNFPVLQSFAGGLYYQYSDIETNRTYSLLGLISRQNEPLYNAVEERHLSFFNVFINQVFNIASNRSKSEKISQQVERISQSELELNKLSMIATKTRNGVIIADAQGRIEWVNEAFTNITGYGIEEVQGLKPREFLQRQGVDTEAQAIISEALKKQEEVEVTIRNFKKDGQLYFNNIQITPVFNEDGILANFIAIQRDITKERLTQSELMHVNSKFELITKKANIGIWEWNATNKSSYWNDVLFDQFGFKDGEEYIDVWKYLVLKEDFDKVQMALKNLYQGTSDREEVEYRILRKSDGTLRNFNTLTIAERDSAGTLQRLIGNVIDVTELRKWQADVLLKNEELKKINAELDNFVYRVSHDLRSPLLAIKGIFSLIFSGNGIDEETNEYLQLADASVNRLDNTIQEILEYSRNSRLEVKLESFDVVDIVQDIYKDLKFSSEVDVDFKIDIHGDSVIYSDKARIKVLFKNLLGNSFKYRKKNNQDAFIHFEMKIEGTHIVFRIMDNGEGISKHSISKVFDMFYRGTSTSVGTGLGLYICKEVLVNLNGNIEVESELGKGTTMTVSLPIVLNTLEK